MQAHKDIVASGCRCVVVDEEDDPFMMWGEETQHDDIEKQLFAGFGGAIVHSSAMFRREAVIRAGGYRDFRECEDLDLYLRLAEMGRLANLSETLMIVRRVPTTTSAGISREEHFRLRNGIVRNAYQRRGMGDRPLDIRAFRNNESVYRQKLGRSLQAMRFGYHETARKYALRGFLMAPWRPDAWYVLLSSRSQMLAKSLRTAKQLFWRGG
jgi:hypothetical protein